MTILGISLSTTRSGICVLQDSELLERSLHRSDSVWSAHKQRVIIHWYRHYILKYEVTDIVVKIAPVKSNTKELKELRKRIERLAKKHHCKFDLITRKEIKDRLHVSSKADMVRYVQQHIPDIVDTKTISSDYQRKTVEAILAACTYKKIHG